MRKQETKCKIMKGEKYGTYNITQDFVENHHRTLKAAERKVASRRVRAPRCFKFEVVELI